eukprot:Gb_13718 [translate_table: standard]
MKVHVRLIFSFPNPDFIQMTKTGSLQRFSGKERASKVPDSRIPSLGLEKPSSVSLAGSICIPKPTVKTTWNKSYQCHGGWSESGARGGRSRGVERREGRGGVQARGWGREVVGEGTGEAAGGEGRVSGTRGAGKRAPDYPWQ